MGEADHVLDPAGGGLVTLGDCAKAGTLADRLIPAPGGEDDPGLYPAALQAEGSGDVPTVADLVMMPDVAGVDQVGQDLMDVASGEGDAAT